MVRRLLRLESAPKPADAADALAIAIAEGWRARAPKQGASTPAQRAWAAAEAATKRR